MEHACMPDLLQRTLQLACSARQRKACCRRKICRRYGFCVPPRDEEIPELFRCPYDDRNEWPKRVEPAFKIAERLKKVAEAACAARGQKSPFATPAPHHLDITRPLDVAALFDEPPKR